MRQRRRQRRHRRNLHPRPSLATSPPAYNFLLQAEINAIPSSEFEVRFTHAHTLAGVDPAASWLRLEINGTFYTPVSMQPGIAEGFGPTECRIQFNLAAPVLFSPMASVVRVIGKAPAVFDGPSPFVPQAVALGLYVV